MREAVKTLQALKAEYEGAAKATFMSSEYYVNMAAKIVAIEEAIQRVIDNAKSKWRYDSHWNEGDGLVESYEHTDTGEFITVDEYHDLFNFDK